MTLNVNIDELIASLESDDTLEKAASTTVPESKDELVSELENLLMEKEANHKNGENTEMSQTSYDEGRALARQIMEKVANQIIQDDSVLEAQAGAAELDNPEGSIDEILRQLLARAVAKGAVHEDQILDELAQGSPSVEKAAAIAELVQGGVDFEDAVELVKQAAAEIEEEEMETVKMAALGELIEYGVDFDEAVEIVKEAAEGEGFFASAKNKAGEAYDSVKARGGRAVDWTRNNKVKAALIAAGGIGGVAGAGYGVHKMRQKQAALDELLEAGVDFDDAVEIIKEASEEESFMGKVKRKAGEHYTSAKNKAGEAYDATKAKGGRAVDWTRNNKVKAALIAAGGIGGVAGAGYGIHKMRQKQAALDELIEAGVDFDDAVEIVKEAGRAPMNVKQPEVSKMEALLSSIRNNKVKSALIAAGGVGGVAGASYGVHKMRQKRAALDELLEAGVDFDDAVALLQD